MKYVLWEEGERKKELARKRNQVTMTSDSFFAGVISPVAAANCVLKWVLSIYFRGGVRVIVIVFF